VSHPPGPDRRYFWGNTLQQALTSAARYHQIPPDEIAWRAVEKRHGFVKQPRRFLIQVDPAAPRRVAGSAPAPTAAVTAATPAKLAIPQAAPPRETRPTPVVPAVLTEIPARTRQAPPEPPAASADRPRRVADRGAPFAEPPSPPDEESALAASVAMTRLLRFAGLDLEATVELQPERLEIRLTGADEERLRQLGIVFLDHMGQLLPRLVKALSGKQVLTRIDGAGLRSSREGELQELAREAAARVLATGEPVDLEPLPAGERRIVHLTLSDEARLTTESFGQGVEKRVRIALARPER